MNKVPIAQKYILWRKVAQVSFIITLALIPILGIFRIDIPNTSFEIFGKHIWWNEIAITMGFIALVLSSYFIISAIWGRIFCGWMCPQNIWGEMSDWFEYRLFGQSTMHETKVLYTKEPWHGIRRYLLFVGLIIFLFAMGTLVWLVIGSYFVPTTNLLYGLTHPNTIVIGSLLIIVGMVTVFSFMGHWWCKMACPVGMLPFLLWTHRTMTLQFDSTRKHECEHCNKCFPSCIIQINVKDPGDSKRWCFNCGACVDTCTDVQTEHNNNTKPPLLQIHKGSGKLPASVYIASVVLVGAIALLSYGIMTHKNLEISVTSDRVAGQMYTKNSKGETEINYTIKIHNKDNRDHNLKIKVTGLPATSYKIDQTDIDAKAGESNLIYMKVTLNDHIFTPHKTKEFNVTVSDVANSKLNAQDKGILVVP